MLRQIEFITINMFLLLGWCLFLFVKNYLQEYSRICTIIKTVNKTISAYNYFNWFTNHALILAHLFKNLIVNFERNKWTKLYQ